MASYDRLGVVDASFLHLERLETPMHVGALSVFEGESFFDETGRFRLAEARELVASRLHLIPRFRRRLMDVPLGQGRPIWVDDEHFDITYHVRLTALPNPGSREQLLTLCSRIQAGMLDRTRPLWELWFVEGLAGGHVGLIQKTHHALVDGVSGVDVATVLLDFQPEPTPIDTPPWRPEPRPAQARLLSDSILERCTVPAEMARSARAAVRGPRRAAEGTARVARSFQSLFGRQMVAPRTSLNVEIGRNRRFETVKISLDDVKAVRRSLGGTVNDVVLAGVTGALRRLLESRDESVEGLSLRVLCPVSVRDESGRLALGNQVSAMFVSLPVGEDDPSIRLDEIRATTQHLKESEQALGAALIMDLGSYAATTLLGLAARAAHHQPFYNLIVTNVPGPQVPLYCMGGRMLEAYPVVPLSRNTSVVVGILSYCGQLHFGLFADRDVAADLTVLASAIEDAFAELVKIAAEVDAVTGGPAEAGGA